MALQNKNYYKSTKLKLSIQISLSGLSFCVLNLVDNTVIYLKEVHFNTNQNPLGVLDALKVQFENEPILTDEFNEVCIIHDNDISTFVPKALFNPDCLADYLKFSSKILKSDFITYDELLINDSVNVYVPYVNINNYIYESFGEFTYKHISTVLVNEILLQEKNSEATKMFVNVCKKHFEIIMVERSKLKLYNTFNYKTKEDFVYFILFTTEQLNLNPETLELILLGDISKEDDLYKMAYKYLRHIRFGNRKDPYKYSIQPKNRIFKFYFNKKPLMRIISGQYKSRKINVPKNLPVRPTTDMAKESLFNIINNHYYFDEISVLDLFAGTGNISYEFASRGTERITCVDQDFGCIKFINQTAEKFNMPIETIKSDVFKYLEKSSLQTNIIFADPPYDFSDAQFAKIPEFVFQNNLLLDEGILIVEHSKHTNLSYLANYSYSKSYGGSVFSFFEIS